MYAPLRRKTEKERDEAKWYPYRRFETSQRASEWLAAFSPKSPVERFEIKDDKYTYNRGEHTYYTICSRVLRKETKPKKVSLKNIERASSL